MFYFKIEPRLKLKKIGRSTDGGGWGLKFFKIILLANVNSRSRLLDHVRYMLSPVRTVLSIHTSDYLRYLRRKQAVTPYPPHMKNVTTLPCKMQNFFI